MTAFLDLVDPQQGLPLQTWRLNSGAELHIGRAEGADIQIASPFVSRSHACLQFRDGAWEVTAVGDKSLQFDGERVTSLSLQDGTEFRLTPKGPVLRLRLETEATVAAEIGSATISFDERSMPILQLDRSQRDREVQEIMEDDYFRNVQQIATALRRRRSSDAPS